MRRILLAALLMFVYCYTVGAGNTPPKVLLEIRTSGAGMINFTGDHLYLRLFNSGQIEYEDIVSPTDFENFVLLRSKLSRNQLEAMVALLDRSDLRAAKPEYSPDATTIDHTVTIDISIMRGSVPQVIKLTNYHPFWPKSKGKYPVALVDLVCHVDASLGNNVFRDVETACGVR
jgi:hypothetical protein